MKRRVIIQKVLFTLSTLSLNPAVIFLMVCLYCFIPVSRAQNNFELLIPWENDTSVAGLYAQEMPSGSFFVLSNNQAYYPGPGILIEGPPTFGSGLIKVSQNGNILWKRMYSTNHLPGWGSSLGAQGRVPALYYNAFQERLIIPFSAYAGWMFCDSIGSNVMSATYKAGIVIADTLTGNQDTVYIYYGDSLCSPTYFSAFATINDSVFACLETNFMNDSTYFTIRSFSDSLLLKSLIDTQYHFGGNLNKWFVYNSSDTTFITIAVDTMTGKKLVQINSVGLVSELFELDNLMEFIRFKLYNKSYYVLYVERDSMYGQYLNSHLFKYSENGTVQQQLTINDSKAVDIEITPDGKVLLLCDKSKGDWYDFISQPVRVFLLDTNLNILSYRDFAYPYVLPSSITSTSNNGFAVTGTLLKSILDTSIREPDQVYFLKSHIDSVNIVWTNIPKSDKAKEIFTKLFPNPTSGKITLQSNIPQNSDASITVYNILGELVYDQPFIDRQIDLSHLPAGMYLLRIDQGKTILRKKVIKL